MEGCGMVIDDGSWLEKRSCMRLFSLLDLAAMHLSDWCFSGTGSCQDGRHR